MRGRSPGRGRSTPLAHIDADDGRRPEWPGRPTPAQPAGEDDRELAGDRGDERPAEARVPGPAGARAAGRVEQERAAPAGEVLAAEATTRAAAGGTSSASSVGRG